MSAACTSTSWLSRRQFCSCSVQLGSRLCLAGSPFESLSRCLSEDHTKKRRFLRLPVAAVGLQKSQISSLLDVIRDPSRPNKGQVHVRQASAYCGLSDLLKDHEQLRDAASPSKTTRLCGWKEGVLARFFRPRHCLRKVRKRCLRPWQAAILPPLPERARALPNGPPRTPSSLQMTDQARNPALCPNPSQKRPCLLSLSVLLINAVTPSLRPRL